MESFIITVQGHEYTVSPALHPGFYTIADGEKTAMLGKREDGDWEFALQSSQAVRLSAKDIGKEIEKAKKGE